MNLRGDCWLTLDEVIRQSHLDHLEARRLVKKFGGFLASRNFGDIIKYPAPVADLLVRLATLRHQGWAIEDLKNLLIMSRQEVQEDRQALRSNLLAELHQESVTLLENLEVVMNCGSCGSQMQDVFRTIETLTIGINLLIARILSLEEELTGLRTTGSLTNLPLESADQ